MSAIPAARAAAQISASPLVRFPAPWSSPFHVDAQYPHHLVNGEAAHLFLLNKTAWAFFACKDPAGFVERSRAQGINVLRVALEGRPYYSVLGMELWPWAGTRQAPDWSGFQASYWSEVEKRVRMAGESGLGLDIVLYFTLRPTADDIRAQQAYWSRVLERLGRFPNVLTWEIANEYTGNPEFQDAAGAYFAEHDPYRRPVITSAGTTDEAVWPHKRWMGMAVVHTCTGSTPEWPLRNWYQAVARNVCGHGKPAFNNETGREMRHRNDDPVHRRKQSWTWCCCGAYWTWHSWEGCEGIDDPNYRAAGGEYLQPLRRFFESLPFWRMDPCETVLTPAGEDLIVSCLAEPDRRTTVAYLCTENTGARVARSKAVLRLPSGNYAVSALAPATLEVLARLQVESAGIGRPGPMELPSFQDDLLLRIELTRSGGREPVEGTR